MKKKKIIAISVFLTLILISAIFFITAAIESYNYDIENKVDIFAGFGAALTIVVGAFVVFYELDLFYTVYYFVVKPKNLTKSILNILANVTLFLIFFVDYYKNIFPEDVAAPFVVFAIYVILRISYFYIATCDPNSDN